MNTAILEEIGLTKSEIKVYLALLKLGSSTKKAIVKESGITPSKLYEIADKLIDKGLVSCVTKNKVLHFSAAEPEQVLDFLEMKKKRLDDLGKEYHKIIPSLKSLELKKELEVEVFKGWKGMRTVYQMILRSLKPRDTVLVQGATLGENEEAVIRFFRRFHDERRKRKIKIKILFGSSFKKTAKETFHNKRYDQVRFTSNKSPSEITIWKNTVMIVTLTKVPVVTLIRSKETAASFKDFFETAWKTAKTL